MKDDRLLEDLKSRIDIVDVVSEYIELKRAGQNFKGLCPFHTEKTPSFMVNPDKQRFHCFGCNVGGDAINFVMKYENLSFQETVRLLAKKAGMDLRSYRLGSAEPGLKGKLIEIQKAASGVFVENLGRSKKASSYLAGRGLYGETIQTFLIGYAVREWHHLSNYLKGKGFQPEFIAKSGLVSTGEKGSYDTFRDRIMFPIRDVSGDVIAFGGRVMDGSQPKYLNSPESVIFKKGETLYGLDLAKDAIRKKGYAVIVEGYLDVIVSHQYGFSNTVAPLGTALTPGHLLKLKRFTKKAVLVFDGDEAGKSAARRSIPLLLGQGFDTKILLLPEGDDPDSFLRKAGGESFGSLVSGAKSVIDFVLSVSGRNRTGAVHEGIEMISVAEDAIMREELIGELARKSDRSESAVREELKKLSERFRQKVNPKDSSVRALQEEMVPRDEEELLLSAVVSFPDRLEIILQQVSLKDFINPLVKEIFGRLVEEGMENGLDAISSTFGDGERNLLTRLAVEPGFDLEAVDKNIEDCIKKIRMREFHERSRRAAVAGDPKLLNSLLLERRRLIREAK